MPFIFSGVLSSRSFYTFAASIEYFQGGCAPSNYVETLYYVDGTGLTYSDSTVPGSMVLGCPSDFSTTYDEEATFTNFSDLLLPNPYNAGAIYMPNTINATAADFIVVNFCCSSVSPSAHLESFAGSSVTISNSGTGGVVKEVSNFSTISTNCPSAGNFGITTTPGSLSSTSNPNAVISFYLPMIARDYTSGAIYGVPPISTGTFTVEVAVD